MLTERRCILVYWRSYSSNTCVTAMLQSDCGTMLRSVEANYLTSPSRFFPDSRSESPPCNIFWDGWYLEPVKRWVVWILLLPKRQCWIPYVDTTTMPMPGYPKEWRKWNAIMGYPTQRANCAAPKPTTSNTTWAEHYKWSRSTEAQNIQWWNHVQALWLIHLSRKSFLKMCPRVATHNILQWKLCTIWRWGTRLSSHAQSWYCQYQW